MMMLRSDALSLLRTARREGLTLQVPEYVHHLIRQAVATLSNKDPRWHDVVDAWPHLKVVNGLGDVNVVRNPDTNRWVSE